MSKIKRKKRISNRLDFVTYSLVKYAMIASSARKHLVATNRFNAKQDYRLKVEEEFCYSVLKDIIGATEYYIRKIREEILSDSEKLFQQVKDFCDAISPRKSILVTDNLDKELEKLKIGGKL